MDNERIDDLSLSKLKWRCRRGLLENDIIIERFFRQYESTLTVRQTRGLNALMSLSDNDLLDLNFGRKSLADVAPEIDQAEVHEVLTMLRNKH
jgi:antitoxin CptB